MDSPFLYGKLIYGELFLNREEQQKRLASNIKSGINTILISPRRWGKSSLVKQVAQNFKNKRDVRFCFVDMFDIRTEEDFYKELSRQVVMATSTKTDDWIQTIKKFLSRFQPRLKFDTPAGVDLSFEINMKGDRAAAIDVLELAERLAKTRKQQFVVCIDEFQNIEYFNDSIAVQKQMRAHWQQHHHVTYIIYGSKRHMLSTLFEKQSKPFYRFGDMMYLDKISKEHWIEYLITNFKQTGKNISKDFASQIAGTVQCHSYYVQQFAHIVWNNTSRGVTKEIMDKSLEDMLSNNIIVYEKDFELLSNTQINMLRALCDGHRTNLSSAEMLRNYNLGTSANVLRILDALEKKEIIDRFHRQMEFLDPVFELWLKKVFAS